MATLYSDQLPSYDWDSRPHWRNEEGSHGHRPVGRGESKSASLYTANERAEQFHKDPEKAPRDPPGKTDRDPNLRQLTQGGSGRWGAAGKKTVT